jgi:hypothetical protein
MNVSATAVSTERPAWRFALLWVFIGALLVLSFTMRAAADPILVLTLRVSVACLAAWFVVLLIHAWRRQRALEVSVQVIRTHYVQALVHTTIYVYWAQYWHFIEGQVVLMVAQILFAYAFQALLGWSRGQSWHLGFGPIPIILSTNFFLCFKDDWFYYQFLMIAVGMLAKEFVQWRREGRSVHIFNPSALGLFIVSIILLAGGWSQITWGEEIAIDLARPDHIYLCIFLLGLIVQGLFRVTYVTLAAALTLYLFNIAYTHFTGVYWFVDAGIPIAVFLGLHLLITDPATSPRTNRGRLIFGALYGAGVFFAYGLLEWLGLPRFYDKLLCVPLLNLTVRLLDRAAVAIPIANWPIFSRLAAAGPGIQNLACMIVWIGLFAWMDATHFIGKEHPGLRMSFWEQACSTGLHSGCRNLRAIHRDDCDDGNAAACAQLAGMLTGAADSSARLHALARGCDLGSADACFRLKESLDDRSRALLGKECDGGNAASCYIFGTINLMGIAQASNYAHASAFFRRSCELGSGVGCSVMSDTYRYGVGVSRDPRVAQQGYDKACSRTFLPGCVALAGMLQAGEGNGRDTQRAQAVLDETCVLGLSSACRSL